MHILHTDLTKRVIKRVLKAVTSLQLICTTVMIPFTLLGEKIVYNWFGHALFEMSIRHPRKMSCIHTSKNRNRGLGWP